MLSLQEKMKELVEAHGINAVKDALNEMIQQEKQDEASKMWDIYCRQYGFEPEHLGKTFRIGQSFYQIIGLKTRNRKYPILASNVVNGRLYKFDPQSVQTALLIQN